MAYEKRGPGCSWPAVAAAARTSGLPYYESGMIGIAKTSVSADDIAAGNDKYDMETVGEFEIDFIASSVPGDFVEIDRSSFAVARVAWGVTAVASAGSTIFGIVSAVPGSPSDQTGSSLVPPTGKMWVTLFGPMSTIPAHSTA